MTDDVLDPRLWRIIKGIYVRTNRKEIAWEIRKVRGGNERFDFSTPDSTITVYTDSDNDVVFEIRDDTGIVIESVGAWKYPNQKGFRETLNEIYSGARRSALNIDARLDQLDKMLGLDE